LLQSGLVAHPKKKKARKLKKNNQNVESGRLFIHRGSASPVGDLPQKQERGEGVAPGSRVMLAASRS
jgi:hypothetical protein